MKTFFCKHCKNVLLFNNTSCLSCGTEVGFDSLRLTMVPLRNRKRCANHQFKVCNWLVEKDLDEDLCLSCRFNRYVPSYEDDHGRYQWLQLQDAKHRLIYGLLRAKLPLITKRENTEKGLAFDFINENHFTPAGAKITTGHAAGQITINAKEATPLQREFTRIEMGENFRTLIGHFRHEIGHYYWELLIKPSPSRLDQFREFFGNEKVDYQSSLNLHYQTPKQQWQNDYISAYASSHPWEDWAETWAHYFHILDTAETAYDCGISFSPRNRALKNIKLKARSDPYRQRQFKNINSVFHATVFSANNLNRSMGQPDLYPFVIAPAVYDKLNFIHRLILEKRKKFPF